MTGFAAEAVDGEGDTLARTSPKHRRTGGAKLSPTTATRMRRRRRRRTSASAGSGNQLVAAGSTGNADVDDRV